MAKYVCDAGARRIYDLQHVSRCQLGGHRRVSASQFDVRVLDARRHDRQQVFSPMPRSDKKGQYIREIQREGPEL